MIQEVLVYELAYFRFYEELNDFLHKERRKVTFAYEFIGNPSVKDAIEALGVPHVEVDLVVVNGELWIFRTDLMIRIMYQFTRSSKLLTSYQ